MLLRQHISSWDRMVPFLYLYFFLFLLFSCFFCLFFPTLLHVEFEPSKIQMLWMNLNWIGALCLLTLLQWVISRSKAYKMLQGPNSWHCLFSLEYWGMLPDGAVYWALQFLLEVGYIPLANGNDVFQWPGAKSQERHPSKSGNVRCMLRCQTFLSVFLFYLLLFIIMRH